MKHATITIKLCLLLMPFCLGTGQAETQKLIRHFAFDQGFIESVYGNEPTKTVGQPTFVSGVSGQALQLDGSSALIYDDYFDLSLDRFTLTAWVKPEVKDHVGSIAGADTYLIAYNRGEIKSGFYDGKIHLCNSGLYLEPEKWYFLAITYDGQMLRSYINHHLDSIKEVQSKPRRHEEPFIIGAIGANPAGDFFSGAVDEVRLYDGALTKEQVFRLYESMQIDPK